MTLFLDHNKYYRLPWNLTDNAISWLEVTKACNLYCEGCYRENEPGGHKTLDQIKRDLEIFKKYRKTDGVSLAGGDPLVHPEVVEIVRLIVRNGLKPIINTNGLVLDKAFLVELKKAGAVGFTLHVDSKQHRPHWKDKSEIELNELRLRYAEMLAEVGGFPAHSIPLCTEIRCSTFPLLSSGDRNIWILCMSSFSLPFELRSWKVSSTTTPAPKG